METTISEPKVIEPKIKLSITLDDSKKILIPISRDVAMSIPKIREFLESQDTTSQTEIRYTFEFNTTIDAVKILFQWKTCSFDKTKKWSIDDITKEQWTAAATLAEELGDDSFVEYMIEYLDLNMVDPKFITGRITSYIRDCFFPTCECDAGFARENFDKAKEWFKSLSDEDQAIITKVYSAYLAIRGVSLRGYIDSYAKKYIRDRLKEIGPDADEKFNTPRYYWDWHYHFEKDDTFNYSSASEHEGQKIASIWYSMSVEERFMIIDYLNVKHYFEELPKCICKPTFSESWSYFHSEDPKLAEYIWKNMDRDTFLENTNVPQKKRNKMRKSNFQELIEYINFIASREPEKPTRDPAERRLQNALKAAKRGIPVGNRGVRYINSQEVAEAEAKLLKYRSEKKRAAQSARSKAAIAEKKDQMYNGSNNNNNN